MARRSARSRLAWAFVGVVLLVVLLLVLVTMSMPTFWCSIIGSCNM